MLSLSHALNQLTENGKELTELSRATSGPDNSAYSIPYHERDAGWDSKLRRASKDPLECVRIRARSFA